jgi:hypothetical protein
VRGVDLPDREVHDEKLPAMLTAQSDNCQSARSAKISRRSATHPVQGLAISCSSEVIARHPRSYDREAMIFNPLHYLALLEQKTNALDQAAPLEGWQLPEEFLELRRQMEARLGKRGRREYVQVLRLLETFSVAEVAAGVRQALRLPAIAFDAVKHLVLCAIERRPAQVGSGKLSASADGGSSADAGRRLSGAARRGGPVMDTPRVLLEHYLKQLRLPTIVPPITAHYYQYLKPYNLQDLCA